jgi:HSP20 family protein
MRSRWPDSLDLQAEMARLQNAMNHLYSRVVGPSEGTRTASHPALNFWEDEGSFYVEAELPGAELADLEIYVDAGDHLTIQGERKQPTEERGVWHRRERGYGRFSRTVELPGPVDEDKVEARLQNGVLTIQLPKQEEAKARRIPVKGH